MPSQKIILKKEAAQEGLTSNQISITDSSVKTFNFPRELPCHSGVGWSETGIRAIRRLWNFPEGFGETANKPKLITPGIRCT